jgi:hypothetical protein
MDPETGRFISEDSVNDPNNPNLYVYCRNNPLTITDPTGNITEDNNDEVDVFAEAAENAYENRADENDPFRIFKDLGTLIGEWLKSSTKHDTEKRVEEKKQTIEIAKALLEINGVSKDDPDYEKKLQKQVDELEFAKNSAKAVEEGSNLAIGSIGGVKVVGEKATAEIVEKLFGKEVASKIEQFMGKYEDVGGHHIHAKAAFRDAIQYDPEKGFTISQEFMKMMGWKHEVMTAKQWKLFNELAKSGKANTLIEQSRIAMEALEAAGATKAQAKYLVNQSLKNLAGQGVTAPTRIPWN